MLTAFLELESAIRAAEHPEDCGGREIKTASSSTTIGNGGPNTSAKACYKLRLRPARNFRARGDTRKPTRVPGHGSFAARVIKRNVRGAADSIDYHAQQSPPPSRCTLPCVICVQLMRNTQTGFGDFVSPPQLAKGLTTSAVLARWRLERLR
jgi:hypothetical protein